MNHPTLQCSRTFILQALLLGTLSAFPNISTAAKKSELQGALTQITDTMVTLDGTHTFKFIAKQAKCFDPEHNPMTCDTLVGVGYADQVQVTVAGDTVIRIDIIELQQ